MCTSPACSRHRRRRCVVGVRMLESDLKEEEDDHIIISAKREGEISGLLEFDS